ncbi:hypothetical protein LPJ60_004216 [Coemansia sp. RSA 2675]|uniref:Uncharacterized protein n=1 Tax=Coemansia linderi TaxID=2663919 RepID=A0ACC1KGD8_9FUNG|nr:hypothetical protein LPJ60_004216 [Coemansia sp. RSA 2675]KAJ2789505.1 hypothetical protein GGI18_002366 [Coemansia linderi]
MASFYPELGVRERDDSQDEGVNSASHSARGRWMNNVVDDFMSIESHRPTPVPALASPQSFLSVARLFGDFMDNGRGNEEGAGSEHQRFLEGLVMQLYDEANASATGPPPASREFLRTLPVVADAECKVPSDDPQWLEKRRDDDRRKAGELNDAMMYG